MSLRNCEERSGRSNPVLLSAQHWIASWSLSSGAHSRDPLARNDEEKHSPNRRNPANLMEIAPAWPCLDIRAMAAMFAQPLGSLSRQMRNIITKLLLIVVPRRTAGDG
jgi:hypothetical protein